MSLEKVSFSSLYVSAAKVATHNMSYIKFCSLVSIFLFLLLSDLNWYDDLIARDAA